MLLRLGVGVAGAVAALAVAAPASAAIVGGGHGRGHDRPQQGGVIRIADGSVPARAQGRCPRHGGKLVNRDRWDFTVFSRSSRRPARLAQITAYFDVNGDGRADRADRIDRGSRDGDDIVRRRNGDSGGWIVTRAGWRLVDARATVSGGVRAFRLTDTCAGPRHHGKPDHRPPRWPTPIPIPNPQYPQAPSLPVTGGSFSGILGGGVGLVSAGGMALVTTRLRRRRPAPATGGVATGEPATPRSGTP
ncbi:hypothetical protein GCM10010124_08850 [Pilimelia terevasa]|uniref:Uncharacterized protein n=1 Tax=Pilimelia terevasa TaxID=53372 RepID=A0A8J3FGT9_9ACTN|nr:hypothetical protein [Pilimelia terevasa]GGK18485.1 hypothetical protein GCM10010124_08850 [Pilimelia terevasa]